MSNGPHLGKQLPKAPSDGITSLQFFGDSKLIASSWDKTARIYDVQTDQTNQIFNHDAPVLDAAIQSDNNAALTAGLDGQIKRFDLATGAETVVGRHDKPVKCVESLSSSNLIASGSWDTQMKLWDLRSPAGAKCIVNIPLPGKAFSMSTSSNTLVVATSQRQVLAYDTRRMDNGQAFLQRESSLKFQTRCLRCFPDAQGYAISSVEGRVAIEYFDNSVESQVKKFAFKCHRSKEGGEDVAHPVNAIAFQPIFGTFATGGSDGVVNIWDKENKKRLTQLAGYSSSIAALAFSKDGTSLAIAVSYTFEKGDISHPDDQIHIRQMDESDVRPKTRK